MTAKYQVKRARAHIRLLGTNLFRDVNTVASASYSFEEEKIKMQSTNEVMGDVAVKVIKTSGKMTMTFGDTGMKNFLLSNRATLSVQAPVVSGTFALPALARGEEYKIGPANVTALTIADKTAGTHYRLFPSSGIIVALQDITTAIPACTYSSGSANVAAIAAASELEYEVVFDDVLAGEVSTFYRWVPSLTKNTSLISTNEFSVFEVEGDLLLDETKPAGGVLGQFGNKIEVVAA